MMREDEKLPFTAHLDELRSRLIKSFIAVGAGFGLCYAFKETLFEILLYPLIRVMPEGGKLIFTGIPEAFFTYLKVSFLAGIILASPVLLYQFWMFVAPGLYHKERRVLGPIIAVTSFFFIGGALFGYFVVFPSGFKFLLSFGADFIRTLPSMREYLDFSTKLLFIFGLLFELPVALTGLARLGIVSVEYLKRNRKYAVILAFVVGAFLTPDVVSMILMALPLMVLYEIGILGAYLVSRKKGTPEASESHPA
ncbi:MAG: twin-arginine translocase subunit TatC [Desulfobacterales bacterium]|jgi:sec-independent protein translocase protein TatC|nr:twin-arginine translocase subunit TatC [Desulfobacterales bacterium]